jgi:two-component system NarL family response regulator
MPIRVLVADDHVPTREDIRVALEADPRFHVCAEASDAAGAVEAAVRDRPDICLLDIRMPGGGVAATWEISARLPETKIVMLTASEEESDLLAALRAGAASYLVKTIDPRRLPHALHDVCEGRAAIPRDLVTVMVRHVRSPESRRRALRGSELAERLTSREWEVLGLLAQDLSTAQIARRLVLSKSAVRAHIAAVVRKLGVVDRRAAVALFRERSET